MEEFQLGSGMRCVANIWRLRQSRSNVDGVTFLWRIFPDPQRLVRPNVVRFRRRLRLLECEWDGDWDKVNPSVQAWIGHAMHGDTWRLREQIFDAVAFRSQTGKISL